jgi:hypothetical protein
MFWFSPSGDKLKIMELFCFTEKRHGSAGVVQIPSSISGSSRPKMRQKAQSCPIVRERGKKAINEGTFLFMIVSKQRWLA